MNNNQENKNNKIETVNSQVTNSQVTNSQVTNSGYKLEIDKGFRVLKTIYPSIIIVNGTIGVGKSYFINLFRESKDFETRIFPMAPDKIKYSLDMRKGRFENIAQIFEICEQDIQIIKGNLEEYIFTYVYIFPNSAKKYAEHIHEKIKNNQIDITTRKSFLNEELKIQITNYNNKIQNNKTNITDKIQNNKTNITDKNENIKLLNKLVLELIKINKIIYEEHQKQMNGKILTILV